MKNRKNVRHNVGDKVIALNSTPPSDFLLQKRIKGKVYEILDVLYCSKCGIQSVNITTDREEMDVECDCGHIGSTEKCWTYSWLFTKPEELEGLLNEAVEEERYEDASELHKMIEKIFQP
jgi:hypothetical protein